VREVVLIVEGLHCGSCAAAVEALLRRQPGVIEAAVNFAADSAMLRWDDTHTELTQLQQAVARLGYRLRDPDDIESVARDTEQTRKRLQWRLAVALVFGMWSMMPALLVYLAPLGIVETAATRPLAIASSLFALPVIGYSGSHFYRVGWRTLRVGVPGLDTLISVAVAAACLVSVWRLSMGHVDVYFDAAVMLITFQLVARLIDGGVRRRAADVVRGYLRQAPETVTLINDDGTLQTRPAADVSVAQHIKLAAGQPLALDGRVVRGTGYVDLAMLSGEHMPQRVDADSELLAGCHLIDGELELIVTAGVGQRRIDGLARSVRGLLSLKTALQRLTDQLARLLLPIIVIAAAVCIVLAMVQGLTAAQAVIRGLAVLVVACPCALSLAIPLVVVLWDTLGWSPAG
jgi:cation transport ATPase